MYGAGKLQAQFQIFRLNQKYFHVLGKGISVNFFSRIQCVIPPKIMQIQTLRRWSGKDLSWHLIYRAGLVFWCTGIDDDQVSCALGLVHDPHSVSATIEQFSATWQITSS
ncbi:hypothetical protein HY26_17610 [Hyphomonas sp. GM-8P]|nr:hypothetical protein HY26_17610 [Hyphomonas sp. GM-8P]